MFHIIQEDILRKFASERGLGLCEVSSDTVDLQHTSHLSTAPVLLPFQSPCRCPFLPQEGQSRLQQLCERARLLSIVHIICLNLSCIARWYFGKFQLQAKPNSVNKPWLAARPFVHTRNCFLCYVNMVLCCPLREQLLDLVLWQSTRVQLHTHFMENIEWALVNAVKYQGAIVISCILDGAHAAQHNSMGSVVSCPKSMHFPYSVCNALQHIPLQGVELINQQHCFEPTRSLILGPLLRSPNKTEVEF